MKSKWDVQLRISFKMENIEGKYEKNIVKKV